jgi:thiol-disulfide isomerase/thioredoxin
MAPDFTLRDLQGKETSLRDLRGQVVLLNFWATWCGPCREEMPIIQERYNDGGFALLAINFDESKEIVQWFIDELGIDIPVLLDPGGRVQELYRLRGYPTSFFLDPDGVIRFIHIGEMTASDLDNYLE